MRYWGCSLLGSGGYLGTPRPDKYHHWYKLNMFSPWGGSLALMLQKVEQRGPTLPASLLAVNMTAHSLVPV